MNNWDAGRYQDKHSDVWRYGANLLDLLKPEAGERILDVGCGTGQLNRRNRAIGRPVSSGWIVQRTCWPRLAKTFLN